MKKALPIMVQGTHSDAGKSVIATALCRILYEDGFKTAPYKSQNMALNSYITPDGKEIGRAQGVQAEAACVDATTDMNPILIKPTRENESQIVVHGKPYKNMQASSYRKDFFQQGLELIKEAYDRLATQMDCIVIEGAGSPAEINLNDREIVNMRVARMSNSPVILVGDIEKGGVFASLVGTLQLLEQEDRDRVIGVVINKFRGDVTLLEPGLKWFEEYTGKKVIGVIPYVTGLNIDAEDSVVLSQYKYNQQLDKEIDIAVIQYPLISNFTDLDPLFAEADCNVRFVRSAKDIGKPDLIILPGSKNTIEDLQFLKISGIFNSIKKLYQENEVMIFGICGGYQMLGETIIDPLGMETFRGQKEQGLSLLPGSTSITKEKTTVRSEGILQLFDKSFRVTGYEIHMGRTINIQNPLITLEEHSDGAKNLDETIIGTYFHGIFHNDTFRHELLNQLRLKKQLCPVENRILFDELRQESFVKLANHVRSSIDLNYIYDKMREFQLIIR